MATQSVFQHSPDQPTSGLRSCFCSIQLVQKSLKLTGSEDQSWQLVHTAPILGKVHALMLCVNSGPESEMVKQKQVTITDI